MKPILFLHGLESGPFGSKYDALNAAYPGRINAPDCTGVENLEVRVWKAFKVLLEVKKPAVVVGSSFGGLVAAILATRYPKHVAGLVLMAPALQHPRAREDEILKVQNPSFIIHGLQDEVVPISWSRAWAASNPVTLFEVEDDHRLHNHADKMVELVGQLLAR